MAKSYHYYIRRSHRYLGIFLGIQFLLWTVSGIYFSWNDMDEVHGDPQKRKLPLLAADAALISPAAALDSLRKTKQADSLHGITLINVNGTPVYQISYSNETHHTAGGLHHNRKVQLANARTGALRGALSEAECIALAKAQFNGDPKLKSVQYLTAAPGGHEYRESPLPAYAVRFDHPTETTVYVASELGVVTKYRNHKWRIYDFLWMLHIMDYENRDSFGHLLLKIFSVMGLLTVLSGFVLYFISSKRFRKKKQYPQSQSQL
jgi:uncharacterized iron-regulated membrane protein